jgi:hypothetical protein
MAPPRVGGTQSPNRVGGRFSRHEWVLTTLIWGGGQARMTRGWAPKVKWVKSVKWLNEEGAARERIVRKGGKPSWKGSTHEFARISELAVREAKRCWSSKPLRPKKKPVLGRTGLERSFTRRVRWSRPRFPSTWFLSAWPLRSAWPRARILSRAADRPIRGWPTEKRHPGVG